jgi:hypothetical protein
MMQPETLAFLAAAAGRSTGWPFQLTGNIPIMQQVQAGWIRRSLQNSVVERQPRQHEQQNRRDSSPAHYIHPSYPKLLHARFRVRLSLLGT